MIWAIFIWRAKVQLRLIIGNIWSGPKVWLLFYFVIHKAQFSKAFFDSFTKGRKMFGIFSHDGFRLVSQLSWVCKMREQKKIILSGLSYSSLILIKKNRLALCLYFFTTYYIMKSNDLCLMTLAYFFWPDCM